MFDNYYPRMWWSKMTILKKSSHRMTKTFWETINEHPLRVSSQYRDHPLAYIAEQGFCGRIPRAIRYHRLIVLLSTMTDWSCCTQTRRYDRLLSAMTDCTAKPDPTQHNRYPRLLYYLFWAKIEVPQGKIDQVRIPREALELTNQFISLGLITKNYPSKCWRVTPSRTRYLVVPAYRPKKSLISFLAPISTTIYTFFEPKSRNYLIGK